MLFLKSPPEAKNLLMESFVGRVDQVVWKKKINLIAEICHFHQQFLAFPECQDYDGRKDV